MDVQALLEKYKQISGFTAYNHFIYDVVEPDYCEMHLDLQPESLNPEGNVHGGAFFSLADSCGGGLARADGRTYVTQNASCNYLATVSSGRIIAKARPKRRGRTVCVADIDIFDENDRLLFSSTFNYFCVSKETPVRPS